MDHFEYRAVGDVVNSASRLEGLNKSLRTRILASQDVVEGLDGLCLRHLGKFRIAGKHHPLEVCELIGLRENSRMSQRELCDCFGTAMDAFSRGDWEQALRLFRQCLTIRHEDGPAVFYRDLCQEFMLHPPKGSPEAVCPDRPVTRSPLPSQGADH
jgi:adenylate cyclase